MAKPKVTIVAYMVRVLCEGATRSPESVRYGMTAFGQFGITHDRQLATIYDREQDANTAAAGLHQLHKVATQVVEVKVSYKLRRPNPRDFTQAGLAYLPVADPN